MQDSELLRAYVSKNSEAAFAELVKRYVNLVHSTARRHVGDDQLAREASQAVFCLLAKKAAALMNRSSLAGWLYQTTSYTAARMMRAECRRRDREKEAAFMYEPENQDDRIWNQLEPLLDDGLKELNEADRLAILLRFFQRQPVSEVASALGVSEPAAKMRVARALGKLRVFFDKRGVACSSVLLASLLSQRAVNAAPVALSAASILGVLSGKGVSAAASPTFSLFEIAMLTMKTQTKIAVVCGVAGLLLGGAVLVRHTIVSQPRPVTTAAPNVSPVHHLMLSYTPRTEDPQRDVSVLLRNLEIALRTQPVGSGRMYPAKEVIEAICQFALSQHETVFVCLKAAAADPDPEVRLRAISGMRALSAQTPGLTPFLWETLRTSALTNALTAQLALNSLQFGGSANYLDAPGLLTAGDIPSLLEVLSTLSMPPDGATETFERRMTRRQIAGVLEQFLDRDAEATAQYLPQLKSYLNDPNPIVRLEIACVLAKREAGNNPKVLNELITGLQNPEQPTQRRALEGLQGLGATAKPALQAVLDYAASVKGDLKTSALEVAGAIDPSLRQTNPEVEAALTARENETRWTQAYASNTLTLSELEAALADPEHSIFAAYRLGGMGYAAVSAIPSMIDALDFNVSGRNEVLTNIYRIDPNAQIERFDSRVLREAFWAAVDSLQGDQFNVFNKLTLAAGDQWTKGEVVKFSTQLASKNPEAWRIFIGKLRETYPSLAASL